MSNPTREDLEALALKLNRMRSSKRSVTITGRVTIENTTINGCSGRTVPIDIYPRKKGIIITIEGRYPASPIPKGRKMYSLLYDGARITLETEGNWRYAECPPGPDTIEIPVFNLKEGAKARITPVIYKK